MSDPYTTILRDIASDPNQYALMVIASWCDKSADCIEELEAENERLRAACKRALFAIRNDRDAGRSAAAWHLEEALDKLEASDE